MELGMKSSKKPLFGPIVRPSMEPSTEPSTEPGMGDHDLWKVVLEKPGAALHVSRLEVAREALTRGVNLTRGVPPELNKRGRLIPTQSILLSAVWFRRDAPIIGLLLDAGAKPSDTDEANFIFHYCVDGGGGNSLHLLLASGVLDNIDALDFFRHMGHIAVQYSDRTIDMLRACITYAISRGANLSDILAAGDQYNGETLLHRAVVSHNLYCDIGCEDDHIPLGHSPRVPIVEFLIQLGANVLMKDDYGHTPAYYAIKAWRDPDPQVCCILAKETLDVMKFEAFAMGYHPRLGERSMISAFDIEVVRMIREMGRLGQNID